MVLSLSREPVCVVGVGTSREFGFDLGRSPMALQAEAFAAALDDSGLGRADVDGYTTATGSPTGVDYEEFIAAAGLKCRFVDQAWAHGRWAAGSVAHATLAILSGMADVVAVINTNTTRRGYAKHLAALGGSHTREGLRDFGGGHGEWSVHGMDTPGVATAMVAQRYMDKYGATEDDLSRIACAFRENATNNPMATMREKHMDADAYIREPRIAGPFRRADFSLTTEGSTCLLLASQDRARDLRSTPVVVAGAQSIRADRDSYVMFSRPGLGVGFGGDFPYIAEEQPVYRMAGVSQTDVDGLYIYDAFSSNVWTTVERFGFCGEGEAPHWVKDAGMTIGSPVVVNSNGGLMSEGHFSGYAHLVEMVRQLRAEGGPRQIADAQVLQWMSPWGDSLIFTSDRDR